MKFILSIEDFQLQTNYITVINRAKINGMMAEVITPKTLIKSSILRSQELNNFPTLSTHSIRTGLSRLDIFDLSKPQYFTINGVILDFF